MKNKVELAIWFQKNAKLIWMYTSLAVVLVSLIGLTVYCTNGLQNYDESNFRNGLEIIYFFTSPVLMIASIIGLRQLTISKENSKQTAKREAFKLAVEQNKHFTTHVIPKFDEIDDLMKESDIKSFGEVEVRLVGKELKAEYLIYKNLDFINNPKHGELILKIIDVINDMDSFAVYFNSGVGRESVAFSAVGQCYVEEAEKLLPIACATLKPYQNMVLLFLLWKEKLEKEKASKYSISIGEKVVVQCEINIDSL